MAKVKIGLELEGFEELIDKLEKLNGDVKEAVSGSLRVASDTVASNLEIAMRGHKRTGKTAGSIIKRPDIKWQGTIAEANVGFRFPEGLPSIFLMYGTPRMNKDQKVYNAVYGVRTRKEIAEKQSQILYGMINKRMGG